MRKTIVGVMGPGAGASEKDLQAAYELGRLIAAQDWVLLSGGRNEGVMEAVNKGAKSAGGITIGVLPTADNDDTSEFVDFAILTGMGSARNNINVLSSDVVVACGMGAGTASEISLALKARKPVVLLSNDQVANEFFMSLNKKLVHLTDTPAAAVSACCAILGAQRRNCLPR